MADIVLDSGPLAHVLRQYFQSEDRNHPKFQVCTDLPREIVRQLNRIVRGDGRYVVVASVLAFVKLAYNWDTLVAGHFHQYQLAAFLAHPPDWFVVEPMDADTIRHFGNVPAEITMPSGQHEMIEWTDAIHAATAYQRDEARLVTTDRRLKQLTIAQNYP